MVGDFLCSSVDQHEAGRVAGSGRLLGNEMLG